MWRTGGTVPTIPSLCRITTRRAGNPKKHDRISALETAYPVSSGSIGLCRKCVPCHPNPSTSDSPCTQDPPGRHCPSPPAGSGVDPHSLPYLYVHPWKRQEFFGLFLPATPGAAEGGASANVTCPVSRESLLSPRRPPRPEAAAFDPHLAKSMDPDIVLRARATCSRPCGWTRLECWRSPVGRERARSLHVLAELPKKEPYDPPGCQPGTTDNEPGPAAEGPWGNG
jgi:hypothetical protein